jgi:hypothetical protein
MTRLVFKAICTIFLILLFFPSAIYAFSRFKNGDQANVWVIEGLSLNKVPAQKSDEILHIPYGQSLTLIATDKTKNSSTINFKSNTSDFPVKLKGYWIKVSYKGKEGYVFDGFLSKMPCFNRNKHGGFEEIQTYLARNYGLPMVKNLKDKDKTTKSYYKNGVLHIESSYDGCFDDTLFLNGINYQEALLFENVYNFEADAAQDIKIKKVNGRYKISCYSCT